ncbi:MAG TPA: aminotransferase class V-fold PLP-dependent enzyme [Ktedonobacterales bacterium]|nr:aminotransferase class V-fold PLP-dependent enzyme [Ktedonobacterales bacterium]
MSSLSDSPELSTPADSDEPTPPLVPLLKRILGATDPAFRATLDDRALATEDALRHTLFPVTRAYAYLNHAGVGPPPAPVAWAARDALDALSCRGSLEMDGRLPEDDARQRFARLINVAPETIAFTKNVSDSFVTVAQGLDWRPGDNVVTIACEFPANVYPWLNLSEQGVETRFAPVVDGRVTLEDIAALIDERTRLVSVSFVEFGTGMRNDVGAIARLAHAAGALCAVDAIQGLGALRLDVTAAEIDFLGAGSAKWLLSPSHIGLLYVRPSALPLLRVARLGWRSVTTPFDFFTYDQALREDAGRLEGGSNSWIAQVMLDAALRLLEAAGAESIEARALALAQTLRVNLRQRGYTVTSPDAPTERSQIVTIRWGVERDDAAASTVVARLASEARVVISARSGQLRISPHFYTTEDDIERLLCHLDMMRQKVM